MFFMIAGMLGRALNAELTDHMGHEKHDPAGCNSGNSWNGRTIKKLKGEFGEVDGRSQSRR